MGYYEEFCFICGNQLSGSDTDFLHSLFNKTNIDNKLLNNLSKKIKWMKKTKLLLANNKIKSLGYDEIYDLYNNESLSNYGIFIHSDCYKFIKITYGLNLQYKHIAPIKINKIPSGIPPINIDYGEIKKYWWQDFQYQNICNDNNTYMLDSPLVESNKQNITRIKKIVSQLKLKKELRPSPSISASFYKQNDIKIGNNNKFWIINHGKWIEIKDKIIKKNYIIEINKSYKIKIPKIGEHNIISLFLYNYEKYGKNKCKFTLLGTETGINNFENKYGNILDY